MAFDLKHVGSDLVKMSLFPSWSASLRRTLRVTTSPSTSVRSLVVAVAEREPQSREELRPPPHGSTAAVASSRIHIIGRRREQEVDISEALRALRAYSMATTPETVAVDITVDMTLKKNKKRDPIKGPVILPHTFGQERIILFVLESTHHSTALEAGADIVAGEEIFSELEGDAVNFDICLTTPTLLDRFKPLQKILKSKIPTIRRGTVVSEDAITEAVRQFKINREYKSDRVGNIQVPVGKLDFPDEHIIGNISSLLEGVATHRRNLPKTSFIEKVILTSTYGPAFPIRISTLL